MYLFGTFELHKVCMMWYLIRLMGTMWQKPKFSKFVTDQIVRRCERQIAYEYIILHSGWSGYTYTEICVKGGCEYKMNGQRQRTTIIVIPNV